MKLPDNIPMEKKYILDTLAKNLRSLMREKNITNSELAKKSDISPAAVTKILSGSMAVTLPVAITIAEGLDVDLSVLLDGLVGDISRTTHDAKIKNDLTYSIGILSINKQRITCVRNNFDGVVYNSTLDGDLDLAEPTSSLMNLILESIKDAVGVDVSNSTLKQSQVSLVMQSYEFEEIRGKFNQFAERTFKQVNILSDWQITYLSIFDSKPGISLIVDKGVSLSYESQGKLQKLGGWKFPVYDLGGENWLGVEVIKHTIEATEGMIPETQLSKNVLAKFGGNINKITELCFKGARNADVFCEFAQPLIRSYLTGHQESIDIVKLGLSHIQRLLDNADRLIGRELPIAVNGSLLDIYLPLLSQDRVTDSTTNTEKAELLSGIDDSYIKDHGLFE